jgi:hypothetical protein
VFQEKIMDPYEITLAIAVPAAFAAGVIFHKYVIGEAEKIKAHVTAEVDEVRADIASLLRDAKTKL